MELSSKWRLRFLQCVDRVRVCVKWRSVKAWRLKLNAEGPPGSGTQQRSSSQPVDRPTRKARMFGGVAYAAIRRRLLRQRGVWTRQLPELCLLRSSEVGTRHHLSNNTTHDMEFDGAAIVENYPKITSNSLLWLLLWLLLLYGTIEPVLVAV